LADRGSDFGHMGWGDGAWWMMFVWGPVLTVALIALVVWAVRSSSVSGRSPVAESDPLSGARRILAERYARGELDSEEYRERVERLG
ncbi:MAG: SHOCT domain-containing protein, partial [Acidimicrobiia bacterium]|nr:SHOCT domain-containing protein [Acidimicrobiia bacterium]